MNIQIAGQCKHPRATLTIGPTTDQRNHHCPDCGDSWNTWPDRIPAEPAAPPPEVLHLAETAGQSAFKHCKSSKLEHKVSAAIQAAASSAWKDGRLRAGPKGEFPWCGDGK